MLGCLLDFCKGVFYGVHQLVDQIVQWHDVFVVDKSIIRRIPDNTIDIGLPDHIHDEIHRILIVLPTGPNLPKNLKRLNINPRQYSNPAIRLPNLPNILLIKQMLILPNQLIIPNHKIRSQTSLY